MDRPDILILAAPEDAHYQAVDWALRSIGLSSFLLYGNCFPQFERQTLLFDSAERCYSNHHAAYGSVDLLSPSVVWNRRAQWPVVADTLAATDKAAALREAEMFAGGVRSIAARRQRWVNDPDNEAAANRKPYQLEVALQCGFEVPRTIMSNDPIQIRNFFDKATGEVVIKAFHALEWHNNRGRHFLFAKKLKFSDIKNSEALRYTTHIFQDYIKKKYELRVFYLGGKILPFRLNSQEQSATRTDWRLSTDGSLRPTAYSELPRSMVVAIDRYMKVMGLEFGAFDLIADLSGNYVFLECNVSGQFLFIEEWNPEIQMLSAFVRFLTCSLNLTSRQQEDIGRLRYSDFCRSAEARGHYAAIAGKYDRNFVSRNVHVDDDEASTIQ